MTEGPSGAAKLLNFFVFQITWFVAVLGASDGQVIPALASVTVAAMIAIADKSHRRRTTMVILLTTLIGLAVDGSNVALGVISPNLGGLQSVATWLFIAVLWANFGTTLRSSLAYLQSRPILAALFGAIGAPLSYAAGARLGALDLGPKALVIIAAEWSVLCPLIMYLAREPKDQ